MGFTSCALPPTRPAASTPGRCRHLPSAIRCHSDRPVPSSWFLTTSTACSAGGARVYCNPMPDRVRCVSRELHHAPRRIQRPSRLLVTPLPFLASAFHTPRRIPLASSRTASLRPLPSCRFRVTILHLTASVRSAFRCLSASVRVRVSSCPMVRSSRAAPWTPRRPPTRRERRFGRFSPSGPPKRS